MPTYQDMLDGTKDEDEEDIQRMNEDKRLELRWFREPQMIESIQDNWISRTSRFQPPMAGPPRVHLNRPHKCRRSRPLSETQNLSLLLLEFRDCMWSFETPEERHEHEMNCHGMGTFQCLLCKHETTSAQNVFRHWRTNCVEMQRRGNIDRGVLAAIGLTTLKGIVFEVLRKIQDEPPFNEPISRPFIEALCSDAMLINIFHTTNHFTQDFANDMYYNTDCHLCGVNIPLRYLSSHLHVHRGTLMIDAPICNRYMCHICGSIKLTAEELHEHWLQVCAEVIAFNPCDVFLEGMELKALVFYILQQSIPIRICELYLKQSMQILKKDIDRELFEEDLNKTCSLSHLPLNVAPYPVTVTLSDDRFNILDKGQLLRHKTVIERINYFACCFPCFYSGERSFAWYDDTTTKETVKRILRYTPHRHSIVHLYGQKNKLPKLYYENSIWNNTEDHFCRDCGKSFSSAGRKLHHYRIIHLYQQGFCWFCSEQGLCGNDVAQHWSLSCVVMSMFLRLEERCFLGASKLRQFAIALSDTVFSKNVPFIKKQIDSLRAQTIDPNLYTPTPCDIATAEAVKMSPLYKKADKDNLVSHIQCTWCDFVSYPQTMHMHMLSKHNLTKAAGRSARLLNMKYRTEDASRTAVMMNLEADNKFYKTWEFKQDIENHRKMIEGPRRGRPNALEENVMDDYEDCDPLRTYRY